MTLLLVLQSIIDDTIDRGDVVVTPNIAHHSTRTTYIPQYMGIYLWAHCPWNISLHGLMVAVCDC